MNVNSSPLISIITPCYNVEDYIEDYLLSVLAQTYKKLELILINDGSTDNTEQMIFKYKSKLINEGILFRYIFQENSGQAAALNRGLEIFSGEYITWPDADDIMSPNNIQVKLDFLLHNKEYQLVRGRRLFFKDYISNSVDRDKQKVFFNEHIFYDLFMERTFANGGCYLMSANLFLECYPDRNIFVGLGSQNWQLLVPAASRSKCGNIDKYIFYLREVPTSFSRRFRTLEELFARYNDHKDLLLDSFEHSICDYEECKKVVETKYIKKKFSASFRQGNKKLVTELYNTMRVYNIVTLQDKIKLFTSKSRITYWAFNLTYKLLKKVKALIKPKR